MKKIILSLLILAGTVHAQSLIVISGSKTATLPTSGTPTFSPGAGSYGSTQSVTISATGGSVICYNTTGSPATNGTTGCTTGTLYTGAVSVSTSETLYAVSGGTGYTNSAVGSAAYTISGPNTWTLVRHTVVPLPCNNSTSCSATVPAIGSGNVLVLIESGSSASSANLTSTFGAIGGSWVHPGGSSAGACNSSNPSIGSDCAYVLYTTACSSSCNITYTTSGYYFVDSADIFEYTPSTGSAAYDTAGVSSGTFSTTPPVVALTIAGTSDLVIQNVVGQDNYCTAVGSPYTSASDFSVSPQIPAGYAAAVNLSSVTASPTWMCGNTRYTTMAVAFK